MINKDNNNMVVHGGYFAGWRADADVRRGSSQ